MPEQHEDLVRMKDRIARIAETSETVSINLLAAIDETLGALHGMASVMSGIFQMLDKSAEEIASMPVIVGRYIDEDDAVITSMDRAILELKTLLYRLVLRHSLVDRDGRLKDHHCESLHDAYERVESEVAGLIEVLHNTRAAVIAHDLRAEPREGMETFATVEELVASLRCA
ncbi:MAG: hypothetical protein V5B60_18880 [Accumulibacter sp.]|jgi:hypothetical protein|uniref:hypothetical protein n=1 Tax=Accumulibacter sp. TaxID=2053492 RepID=UPI002FC35327